MNATSTQIGSFAKPTPAVIKPRVRPRQRLGELARRGHIIDATFSEPRKRRIGSALWLGRVFDITFQK